MIVEPGLLDLGLEPLADDVELALEGVGVGDRGPRPTRAWNIFGSTARALAPSVALSVASGRQPRNTWPSSATIVSKISLPNFCWAGSGEVKNAPTP